MEQVEIDVGSLRPVYVNLRSRMNSDYARTHQIENSTVFAQVDPKVIIAYSFDLTPEVILVDSAGKIQKVWLGLLRDEELAALKEAATSAD